MRAAPAEASGPEAAAARVRDWLGERRPALAVVMGSGLGGLTDRFEGRRALAYGEVPGWPRSGVEGHAGALISGRLGGRAALGLSGRAHHYEGHAPEEVAFPVRVLGRLGIRVLFLSNAAGAVDRRLGPGGLMLVADHLDLTWRNPLVGPTREGEDRFPDMKDCYDPRLRRAVREAAAAEGIGLEEGVYAGMLGPSYETPAEIRMLQRLGAHAVGMSTVPEVTAARASGIRCVAVSCITNYAAGLGDGPPSHDEVLETAARAAAAFERLAVASVRRIGEAGALDGDGEGPAGATGHAP